MMVVVVGVAMGGGGGGGGGVVGSEESVKDKSLPGIRTSCAKKKGAAQTPTQLRKL